MPFTGNHQPVLDLDRSRFELFLQGVAALGVVLAWWTVIAYWPDLPASFPSVLDPAARGDALSGRGWLLAMPTLSLALWIVLGLLERIPHRFAYPWRIGPRNAAAQYRLSRALLTAVKAWVAWVIFYLVWVQCLVAVGERRGVGPGFVPAILFSLFLVLVVYFVQAYRER